MARKKSDKSKTSKIELRIHPDEKERLSVIAELAGMPLSTWVLMVLEKITSQEQHVHPQVQEAQQPLEPE
jgi:hypothetical protein